MTRYCSIRLNELKSDPSVAVVFLFLICCGIVPAFRIGSGEAAYQGGFDFFAVNFLVSILFFFRRPVFRLGISLILFLETILVLLMILSGLKSASLTVGELLGDILLFTLMAGSFGVIANSDGLFQTEPASQPRQAK